MTKDERATTDSGWAGWAGRILDNLGFCLVEADETKDDTNHVLVALRPMPTLRHFDPEQIDYWVTEAGRGRSATLDRETRCPLDGKYSWGRITITDRLGVSNQFLSFGGALRAERTAEGTILVGFSSLAPIPRWSGHSQGLDQLTDDVGAFFARMMVPIDFVPGAEEQISAAAPRTLYCAFLQHAGERLNQARTLREASRWLAQYAARESRRMEAVSPDDWRAALELRRRLGLVEEVAHE
jgi:hypothetical protein